VAAVAAAMAAVKRRSVGMSRLETSSLFSSMVQDSVNESVSLGGLAVSSAGDASRREAGSFAAAPSHFDGASNVYVGVLHRGGDSVSDVLSHIREQQAVPAPPTAAEENG
jgi:hypothetical protein